MRMTATSSLWRSSFYTLRSQWQAAVEPVQVGVDAVVAAEILLRSAEPRIEAIGCVDVLVVENEGDSRRDLGDDVADIEDAPGSEGQGGKNVLEFCRPWAKPRC